MATKTIYLINPYTDVIKVNALTNSVFRLNLNGGIVYTVQEIWDKIDAIQKLNSSEDEITRIGRFIASQMNNVYDLRSAQINIANLIQNNNSYSNNICGGISLIALQIFKHYLGDTCDIVTGGDTNGSHQWNCFDNGAFDNINKYPFYKGKYQIASFEELQANSRYYVEPLRVFLTTWHYSLINYASYITNSSKLDGGNYPASTVDNVYMRMPGGSSFVFPVKSANQPKTEDGTDITQWANLILIIPTGITGSVEMPFNLLQITGTGSVSINGVTYNLPADAATLKAACQTTEYETEKWIHSFTVLTNTEGLEAEFMINPERIRLFRRNMVEYTITSGSISFERVKTTIPVPTHILSVKIGQAGGWTINYDKYFTSDKSLKQPIQVPGWGIKIITFLPNTESKFPIPQQYQNYTADSLTEISAGSSVIDQCFAGLLTPVNTTFVGSIELTFTSVDGSDIYYTTDASTPTAASTKYTAPFTISATTTVKWINIKADYANSHVNTRVITKTA